MHSRRSLWPLIFVSIMGVLALSALAIVYISLPETNMTTSPVTAGGRPTTPQTATPTMEHRAWVAVTAANVQKVSGGTTPIAQLGQGYPLTLLDTTTNADSVAWYHVAWQSFGLRHDGWIAKAQLTFSDPHGSVSMSDLGALDPPLGAYVQGQQGQNQDIGVVVYDDITHRSYAMNTKLPITMGSTIKVMILMTLLQQDEANNTTMSDSDRTAAKAMIELSDNDAATTLYDEINYDTGINAMLNSLNIGGVSVNGISFGYSITWPLSMVQLLTALQDGKVLNPTDRHYMLDLMSHVDASEQYGIGMMAPHGAQVAMKDGWIQDDSGWVDDSIGIVTYNGHTAIVSIYTQKNSTFDGGWQVVNTICKGIMGTLAGKSGF